jgi:hypothetical protein
MRKILEQNADAKYSLVNVRQSTIPSKSLPTQHTASYSMLLHMNSAIETPLLIAQESVSEYTENHKIL